MPFSKGNFKDLTVTWYDATNSYVTNSEITLDIKGLPLFTDTGTGEVNTARLIIRAASGRYITSTSPVSIDQFDRIHITLDDIDGNSYDRWFEVDSILPSQSKKEGTLLTLDCLGLEYYLQKSHFAKPFWFTDGFSVSKFMITQYNARKGTLMPLINDFTTSYNTTTKVGNDMPPFTLNNYEYGNSEDTYYNRQIDLIEKFGGTVAIGGVRDFFELGFKADGVNALKFRLFSSGVTPTTPIVIKNTLSINVGEQEGGIENSTGTVINGWGSNTHGTLPIDLAKYRSGVFQFIFRPLFSATVTYAQTAKIKHNGIHYASIDNGNVGNTPTGVTDIFWSRIDMSSEFGDSIASSPWTNDKRALFKNSGANPNATTTVGTDATATVTISAGAVTGISGLSGGSGYFGTTTARVAGNGNGALLKVTTSAGAVTGVTVIDGGTGYTSAIIEFSGGGASAIINSTGIYTTRAMMFDSNLTIEHEGFTRDWVNERFEGDGAGGVVKATNINYLYADGINNPRGHRLLIIKDGLTGSDRNGKSFTNTIVERQLTRDGNKGTEWVVIKEFEINNDYAQVVVIDEAATYQWRGTTSLFSTISTSANIDSKGVGSGNDCFHDWKTIANVQGFDPKPSITDRTKYPEITADGAVFALGKDSAVEIVYEIPNIIEGTFDVDSFYRKGAWLNFAFPYPINKFNGIGEGVGDLYGGGTISATTGDNEPATLDTRNMSYSHDGLIGFNNGDSTEDLGPLSSLAFAIRVRMLSPAGTPFNGTAAIKVTGYDTSSHKAERVFEVKFTDGTWQPTNLSFSGFAIKKSNKPRWTTHSAVIDAALAGFINLIPPTEQENTETFEWRNLKMLSFQIDNFYDEHGRYAPENNVGDMDNLGLITAVGGRIMLAIDNIHFKKPLLVNSGRDTSRGIEPAFIQRGAISLYDQLKADVEGEEEIQRFRHKEYIFKTSGNAIFDVDFGDTVTLSNSSIVSDSDVTANTINLVAKRIEYSLVKPSAGSGGLTRVIKGVKRFT